MAPTVSARVASSAHLKSILSRTLSFALPLASRDSSTSSTPVASIFALIIRGTVRLSERAITPRSASASAFASEGTHPTIYLDSKSQSLDKRQNVILAIPTTYAGLNSGPAPGALVGIVLGSIAGFILLLYIILSAFRLSGFQRGGGVVEEEVIRHRRRSRSRSRAMTEASGPARSPPRPRRERVVREETVVVEERVEPSVSAEDDIVEVIEEHSPERPPPKRESTRRSGYRTVDPAEFGGGSRPMRKVPRR
ncbi:hypothetical protein LTR10_019467 [Elasticomyces elasticus]|uniref:Uncharacterized protein n=1 Tax=Exophiala sideris TaxID=1016849 RepID=A0ABR0JKD0_9EURO|nr:hypothetical protein LTR10_019467 [Elasticomyces elasticus]KAK5035530.1 hypothetical protein LTS07_002969 [Exophiala sideris]KAK5039120.1 hypothetical protein LTR13_003375 [Exophiala sideris]KAK5066455.1 hypothetical protein LTR69_002975 [Exophiala sideris]KAK5187132.1 hypothetical protein LTR44_001140 [Eurotiomycetes sp. CCFEE 6388]